jgi:hypothetical protein
MKNWRADQAHQQQNEASYVVDSGTYMDNMKLKL